MDREMLGRFIAQRRKELNLTQRELAEALHVTDKAVSKWERGAGCPDISLLEPLAEALGLSVDQLLTYQTAPAETERVEEPAPTSEAVQAVLDLTLAERRARRRRRWFIAMAAALSLIVLAGMYVLLSSLQVQGKLFRNESSTSPNGSITVVTYTGSFGNSSVKVTNPADIQRRWGDGGVDAGMSESYPRTAVTGLYWSPDSAYLAIGQSVQNETPYLECKLWHFYQGADERWYGQSDGSMRLILEHLWHEGDEALKAAFSAVKTAQPSGYPIFDVTIDGWDGTVLQVKCTYTGTDNADYAVTVRYDAATQQVLSAE